MPIHSPTLRVLVALIASLSMLHLTVVGSGVVCSSGPGANAHGGSTASAASTHAGHAAAMAPTAHEHSDGGQQGTGHHGPVPERCCESMSSCGVTTLATVVEHSAAPPRASGISTQPDSMLGAVGAAPEPPPPKA